MKDDLLAKLLGVFIDHMKVSRQEQDQGPEEDPSSKQQCGTCFNFSASDQAMKGGFCAPPTDFGLYDRSPNRRACVHWKARSCKQKTRSE